VSPWTLTPGGEGDRTVVRLAVALRDPQISGWLARARGGGGGGGRVCVAASV
jgi:hypothetical protein